MGRHNPRRESQARLSRARLLGLVWGYRLSQAIYAAARLGVPDLIAAGLSSTAAIAKSADCHEPSLYRVLRALAGAGVLDEFAPRQFSLTPVGEGLRSDVAGSIRPAVLMLLDEWNWRPWGQLLHTVRTGDTAFNQVHGLPVFSYLSTHPEEAASFDVAMASLTALQASAIAQACDLSNAREFIDVGGGRGTLLAVLLRRYPSARGILFDMPHVVRGAGPTLEREAVAARCRLVGGSFFDSLPYGADVCLLRDILHDWDDQRAALILANCRDALPTMGRLIIVERMIGDDPRTALPTLLTDLEMLVNIGGGERTESELRNLLSSAGFRWERCSMLGEGLQHYVIEAAAI